MQWQPERSGDRQRGTSCPQGAKGINEGADFGGGLCVNSLSAAKIKPDAANAWLPQVAADKSEKGRPAPSCFSMKF
jgi:hypothetical protein